MPYGDSARPCYLASSDTRELAAAWLDDNLAPGSAVVINLVPVTLPATLDQEFYLPGSLDARMQLAMEGGWPEETKPALRALHVNQAASGTVVGETGRALFAELSAAGYSVFAVALRDDASPNGLQRAVLADYDKLDLFLTFGCRRRPPRSRPCRRAGRRSRLAPVPPGAPGAIGVDCAGVRYVTARVVRP